MFEEAQKSFLIAVTFVCPKFRIQAGEFKSAEVGASFDGDQVFDCVRDEHDRADESEGLTLFRFELDANKRVVRNEFWEGFKTTSGDL